MSPNVGLRQTEERQWLARRIDGVALSRMVLGGNFALISQLHVMVFGLFLFSRDATHIRCALFFTAPVDGYDAAGCPQSTIEDIGRV